MITPPRTHRLQRADELRSFAIETMDRARHSELRQFIRRALTEIDEATDWLEHTGIDTNPALLTMVDMGLALAEYRLRAARSALAIRGPDVRVIG